MPHSWRESIGSSTNGKSIHFTPKNLPELQKYSDILRGFLNYHQWLIDAMVLDFFLRDHWSTVPKTWTPVLDGATIPEIASFLSGQPKFKGKVPSLSFLSFVKLCTALPTSRHSIHRADPIELDNQVFEDTKYPLTGAFKRHMKGKKRHEIGRLSKMVAEYFEDAGVGHALDVGGGHGHLSRLLCFGYGLRMATLDAERTLVDKAQEFDTKVTRDFDKLKYRNKSLLTNFVPPIHLERRIGISTASEDVAFVTQSAWKVERVNFGLIGLHTCGDLGPAMFRLYRECSQVKALVSVGCCYHKIHKLFPLSKSLERFNLSYEAKEVACHSIELYIQRLMSEDADKGRIHSFRAALEMLIEKYQPELRHTSLATVRYTDGLTFEEYAPRALKKVADHKIPVEEFSSLEIKEYLSRWMHVATFFALRILIAPTIESLLHMDRIMYLLEAGFEVDYIPLFEPMLSPRCHVIASWKT